MRGDPHLFKGFGILRLIAALLLVASITTEIVDRVIHNSWLPFTYFSYLSIQTALIATIILFLGGVKSLRLRQETERFTAVRMSLLVYALMTAAVFAILLRFQADTSYATIFWPKDVIHLYVPLYILFDWLFAPGREPLRWKWLWLTLAFPLLWVIYTYTRGAITGEYPYVFLSPHSSGGWLGATLYLLGIALFALVVAALAIWMSRKWSTPRQRPELRMLMRKRPLRQ